jgi:outer membrane protein OmpA-like peptidoglycan-associated protein
LEAITMTTLLRRALACLGLCFCLGLPAAAQDNPFAGGWVLQTEGSTLGFQSIKNESKIEQSGFATITGTIAEDGTAELRIPLDSVDTKIDLRNVRMRFLFFETFKHPEAVITARIDPATLVDLPTKRRITLTLPYTLSLHGVTKDFTADVNVTLIGDDLVNVATVGMIPVNAADFELMDGVAKLEEAANVKIVPTGSVTFDLLFQRGTGAAVVETAAAAVAPADTALEVEGNFDAEACLGRFEILSRAGNIAFATGSARLDVAGSAILDNLYDIVSRCPDMALEIGGHTDDVGSEEANLALSERRAASVVDYLVTKGIDAARLTPRGYGEAVPLLANDSDENRARNRRIEFKVMN